MKYIKLFEDHNTFKYSIFDIIAMSPDQACDVVLNEIWREDKNPDLDFIKSVFELSPLTVNYQNKLGHSILMFASYFGYVEIVEWLLEFSEINVNLKSQRNQTALLLVCSSYLENPINKEKIIRMLLSRPEIDINIRDNELYTAWAYAALELKEKFPNLKPIE